MPKGDNARKLSDEERDYIIGRIKRGVCMSALARKFKVSRQRIHQLKKYLSILLDTQDVCG